MGVREVAEKMIQSEHNPPISGPKSLEYQAEQRGLKYHCERIQPSQISVKAKRNENADPVLISNE
ncbi:hypothetical protein OZX67_02840 [Bifidobacterium sp. ESL0728]|uniref:hypothetical protein n=1 Tax=Bifidobacterium sp. ESL0728 TaxID=2983220 RepID=UPI0023F95403|nr:hypothetical protein [Bifidobacterium sp. ESL0728]WEV59501.1 hypothetical protein OZX67_02840 [Bifidobacterium sp. ESL0728]